MGVGGAQPEPSEGGLGAQPDPSQQFGLELGKSGRDSRG